MNRRTSRNLGKRLRRWLLGLLLMIGAGFLLYQLFQYYQTRDAFPVGMTVGGLSVTGMTEQEAADALREHYLSPVAIYHREERVMLDPTDVGFNLDVEPMINEAREAYRTQNFWVGFAAYVLGWDWNPIRIPLQAGYDPVLLREMLATVAGFLDEPPMTPQILSETAVFEEGQPGFVTDIETSLELAEKALYRPEDRVVNLVIVEEEAPELNFDLLEAVILQKLNSFDGLGSIFVMDLQTGDEIRINSDVAMSGLSVLKIAIFVEAMRRIDMPLTDYEQQLFVDTATRSSNYSANLLLHVVAGEDNTYKGADMFTESMWELGLENTFIAVPYDAIPPPQRRTTYQTPANEMQDINPFFIDPTRQTTAEDIGSLLAMVYQCANGGGALLAVHPDELTPEECQYIIDVMTLNEEGNLIRFGVPDEVPVSHKHGWIENTHADAGIVLSPGGDYVLVEYLHQDSDWLQASVSFPILREISRAVYNYFNFTDPYLGDALAEEERFDETGGFIPGPDDGDVSGAGGAGGAEEEDSDTPSAQQ